MSYFRRRKLFWSIFFSIIIVCLFFSPRTLPFVDHTKVNHCSFSTNDNDRTVKYIFNLEHWRQLMYNDLNKYKANASAWCDVPWQIRPLADDLCRMYNVQDCRRLPCHFIYSSSDTLEDIQCLNDGRIQTSTNENSDLLCKRGYSLDLFLNDSSYPSIIADPLTPFSDRLYRYTLEEDYRSCDSIWGLRFNFESITNYPWAGKKKNLQLFDLTFGYDRAIYDFVPRPWLYNYIERLKFNSKRLPIDEVMKKKKPIQSPSQIYWTNTQTVWNSSYVRSPIVWMNSNCQTSSKRTEYVHELMKYINVDNYGTCGRNILPLPEHVVQIQNSKNKDLKDRGSYRWEEGKLALIEDYLFTIAIENSLDHDYISEKLWHPLIAGSIPIYLGAPNIDEWLPCQSECIINLRKFANAKEAAVFIENIARNETLYRSYHRWRNEPLKKEFQSMIDYFERQEKFSLDCMICHMADQVRRGENKEHIKRKFQLTIGSF